MEVSNKALYCEKCSLQFDKKIVYDIHLSFVHKMNIEVKSEEKTIEIKEEDESLVLQCEFSHHLFVSVNYSPFELNLQYSVLIL